MPTAPHSPAPWTANGTRVSASDGSEVSDICPQQDAQVFEANRNLICAAPDMLEALKELQVYLQGSHPTYAHALMTAAIRKAEGR